MNRLPATSRAAATSAAALLAAITCAGATAAHAEERPIRGPLEEPACLAVLYRDATPALVEWTAWLAAGAGRSAADGGGEGEAGTNRTRVNLGLGSEVTFPLATLSDGRHYGGAVIARWGPWVGASTSLVEDRVGLVEGGLLLSLGQTNHPPFGTYALRVGAGTGDELGLTRTTHAVITLTGGVHSWLGRYTERGGCGPKPTRAALGWGSVARLFVTYRRSTGDETVQQITFGIELTPSLFFPPYSWMKFAGGRP